MSAVTLAAPRWDVVFLAEVDRSQNYVQALDMSEGTLTLRHWPGPGGWAMAFFVSYRTKKFLRSYTWHGRVGAIPIYEPPTDQEPGMNNMDHWCAPITRLSVRG